MALTVLPFAAPLARGIAGIAPALLPGACRSLGDRRAVALTLDDGPHPDATPRALDALAAAGVKGTFFVIAERARVCPELVRRCVAEGHEVALHGDVHRSMLRASARDVAARLVLSCGTIGDITGTPPRFFRPPYGRWNPRRTPLLRDLGLRLVLWNRSPAEYFPSMSMPVMTHYLERALRGGDIVLLHDNAATAQRVAPLLACAAATLRARGMSAVLLRHALPQWKDGVDA
jgi:peptidoglycan-N-acetylglucosamine deacetylase